MTEQNLAGLNYIEKRYDAVVHMVTAAEGAEEFYNYSNSARFETVEQARERDYKLRDAYLGHHRYMIVDNESKSFEDKISKAINLISSSVGLPTDISIFKKYLVCPDSIDVSNGHQNLQLPEGIRSSTLKITETYLNAPPSIRFESDVSACVRKRQRGGIETYNYEKRWMRGKERIQEMRNI